LEDKLGCILFQLPPSLTKDLDLLKNIVKQLDVEKVNVLEFRDESWFNSEVYEILRENNVVFCSVSTAKLPENLIATCNAAYIRFHGKRGGHRYLYTVEELKNWVEKIKSAEVQKVYCYFNNDYQGNAVKNCQQLKKML